LTFVIQEHRIPLKPVDLYGYFMFAVQYSIVIHNKCAVCPIYFKKSKFGVAASDVAFKATASRRRRI